MKSASMKEGDKSWRIEYLEPASVPHHEDNNNNNNNNNDEEFKEKNESKEEDMSLQD